MPSVGIIFEICHAETLPGQTVRVCGAAPELGGWDPRRGAESAEADVLRLRTGALSYPRWSTRAPVWFSFQEELKEAGSPQDASFGLNDSLSTMDSFDGADSVESLGLESVEPPSPQVLSPENTWLDSPSSCHGRTRMIDIEYKFLKDLRQLVGDSTERFQWEDKIKNRHVSVPAEAGSFWVVTDALWDSDEPPTVARVTEDRVEARCLELDPEHSPRRDKKCSVLPLTPGCCTPRGGDSSFEIEDEFDALANRKLPELLAERLAAEQSASEMAAELMELRRESSMVSSHREQLEEEVRASKEEAVKLKGAMMEMAKQVDESAREREWVIQCEREEKHELREENTQLRIQIEELRLELSIARDMLVTLEDSSKEPAAEAQRLRGEVAELGQECAKLKSTLPALQSQLSEAKASLQAAEESAAKAKASLKAAEESAAKAEAEVAALKAMQEAAQLSLPPACRQRMEETRAQPKETGMFRELTEESGMPCQQMEELGMSRQWTEEVGSCLSRQRTEEAGIARQWTEEMCQAAVTPMSRYTGRQRAVSLADNFAEPRRERTSTGVELKHARTFEETSKEEERKMENLLCKVRKSLSSATPLTKAENELTKVENELTKILRQRFQKVEIRREVQDRGDARV